MWKNASVCIWPSAASGGDCIQATLCCWENKLRAAWDARSARCSESLAVWLLVRVAGILQAWCDMWFIPAGSKSHNKNGTCVFTAMLLTFAVLINTFTQELILFSVVNVICCILKNILDTLICFYVEFHWATAVQSQKTTIPVSLFRSMLLAYLRTGGLATMRNSGIDIKQWLLSQSTSSEENVTFTRGIYQVSCMLHKHFRSWSNVNVDPFRAVRQ